MMATVNKQSLRDEFDALKAEFERLSAGGKMAAESRALFKFGVANRLHNKKGLPGISGRPLLRFKRNSLLTA